ncbi:MAG: calcium/sodium antiporter [Candidatus Aminicenantes bacterium]|nr:calcium/sodium antiporter [Candidatus Aminicenantes bacterium]
MIYIYIAVLIVSFAVLFKSAGFFVEGACSIARVLNISKMVVGIVLVGMATTAPEFGASVIAAIVGHPEIALGNAIGSVICDDGIALALAAIVAPTAILINCRILKTAGLFLISIDILSYILARNGTIGRMEGALFLVILCLYFIFLLRKQRYVTSKEDREGEALSCKEENLPASKLALLKKPLFRFSVGIIGVILTCRAVIWASVNIAEYFSVSKTIIGLTIIAIGTSLPEISTCVTAALKGEGEIAVGNIIGADILNILWIIGVSSIANPITVELKVINFAFPFMILIVITMLVAMRIGCRLGKVKGFILFGLYIVYLVLTLKLFT